MMTSSKTQNNILKIILAPWYREWFKQRKYLRLMKVKYFAFPVEAFWFFKSHENEAKHDKRNFKRGSILAFKVNNS